MTNENIYMNPDNGGARMADSEIKEEKKTTPEAPVSRGGSSPRHVDPLEKILHELTVAGSSSVPRDSEDYIFNEVPEKTPPFARGGAVWFQEGGGEQIVQVTGYAKANESGVLFDTPHLTIEDSKTPIPLEQVQYQYSKNVDAYYREHPEDLEALKGQFTEGDPVKKLKDFVNPMSTHEEIVIAAKYFKLSKKQVLEYLDLKRQDRYTYYKISQLPDEELPGYTDKDTVTTPEQRIVLREAEMRMEDIKNLLVKAPSTGEKEDLIINATNTMERLKKIARGVGKGVVWTSIILLFLYIIALSTVTSQGK